MDEKTFRSGRHPDGRPVLQGDVSVDANVEAVRQRLLDRAAMGLENYGVTTERTDIDFLGWIQHLQDELLDAAVYAERLKKEMGHG